MVCFMMQSGCKKFPKKHKKFEKQLFLQNQLLVVQAF